ncbi:MAG TPA: zinc ribbon domain-containing protein [Rhabdochlamydiaceae bacterium]|nr:zinc ribbon domain-containing protein [Rhabdochlamydiaceae bacterium]
MPTYDYTCEKCHHVMEAFQKITDGQLTSCPKCKAEALKRGIGGGNATFQFKGSGFYQTDYKAPKEQPPTCAGCHCGKKPGSCES